MFKRQKIALVLGGGAARGLCSIGVIKAFERHFGTNKSPFDLVVGTSIGSLVGAAMSSGMNGDELEKKAERFNWPTLVDLGFHPTGFMKGDKLESIIIEMIDSCGFQDMKIPFALTTTDISTGEELLHTSGDLIKLIRASCSWPGFFNCVEIGGRLLADGGIRNSVPTKSAYDLGATFVIAVNPGFAVSSQKIDNALKALVQSIQIMGEELNAHQAKSADVVIKPELKEIGQFDFAKAKYIIQQGEKAAEECIDRVKRKLLLHRMDPLK